MRPDGIAVLGLGAIGGLLAWQARLAGIPTVIGYSPDRSEAVLALKAGALSDIADTPARAVRGASLVVLAAPPAATLDMIDSLARRLDPGTLLTDVASVKLPVVQRALSAGLGDRFAGGHPFAGTEASGWAAARPDLLRGAIVYICPTGVPGGDAVARQVSGFWREVMDCEPVLISAEAHDQRLAWTSHLPQAVAYALAAALASRADLAGAAYGTGAHDMLRLAASRPELWTDIFLHNRVAVVEALDRTSRSMAQLRELIAQGDEAGLREFLAGARSFRRSLD